MFYTNNNTINSNAFIPFSDLSTKQRQMVQSEEWKQRLLAACEGYGLDVLIHDFDKDIRRIVACKGYGLNQLVADTEWEVREAVAEKGYGLEKLVDDPDYHVRIAVAYQDYGLEKLVDDPHWMVRAAVAERGYGLDKLVMDENENLRETVAYQNFGLDKLINDPCASVRSIVEDMLRKNWYATIDEWIAANPNDCVLPENRKDKTVLESELCDSISCDKVRFVELPMSDFVGLVEVSLGGPDLPEERIYIAYDYFRRNSDDEGEFPEPYAGDWEVVKTFVEKNYPEALWVKIGLDKRIYDPELGINFGSILDWRDALTVDDFANDYCKYYEQNNTTQLCDRITSQVNVYQKTVDKNIKTGHEGLSPHVVLARRDDDALVFTGIHSPRPFVIARGYNEVTNSWSNGTYFSDLGEAWDRFNPDIIEDATIRWRRSELRAGLTGQGIKPTDANLQALLNKLSNMSEWKSMAIEYGFDRIKEAIFNTKFSE